MTDPLDEWCSRYAEGMAQAETFARRRAMGIPPDRWASTRQMYLVADGIRGLQEMIAMQSDVILRLTAELGGHDARTTE